MIKHQILYVYREWIVAHGLPIKQLYIDKNRTDYTTSLYRLYMTMLTAQPSCYFTVMGLLPDTQNCGLRMHGNAGTFSPPRLQRKPLVRDPGMHHGTCVTHVPWCMSGSLTRGGGENVPNITGAFATRDFTYLARDPWRTVYALARILFWCLFPEFRSTRTICFHIIMTL